MNRINRLNCHDSLRCGHKMAACTAHREIYDPTFYTLTIPDGIKLLVGSNQEVDLYKEEK